MTRINRWPLILLFTLCCGGLARAAPPAETDNGGAPSAQDDNSPHNAPSPPKTGADQPPAPQKKSRPNVEFKPSEEISEDFSVAFPTDI